MPDDPGRETLAMLARVLADPGNASREDVLSLVAFAQAAAECANEAEAKLAAASGRVRAALAETDDEFAWPVGMTPGDVRPLL